MLTSFIVMNRLIAINADQWNHIMLSNTITYMAICLIAVMVIIIPQFMHSIYKELNVDLHIDRTVFFIGVFSMPGNQTRLSVISAGCEPFYSAIMTNQQVHERNPEAIKLAEEIIEPKNMREIAQTRKTT
jgi:hypothetical protein